MLATIQCVCRLNSPECLVEGLVKSFARQAHVLAPGYVVFLGHIVVNGQL